MDLTLPYGRGERVLQLDTSCEPTVIRKRPMAPLADPLAAVSTALNQPVGSPALMELARGCRTACILICDITRPVPNAILLPGLLKGLLAAGLQRRNITILVATGLHRPNKGAELRELVGNDDVLDTVAVQNHYAERTEDHVALGHTAGGTPILLDRRFVHAELRLITGLVEPHFMAGYSGGRKLIVPGIAHARTISRIHAAEMLDHTHATNCRLDGNPLHAEQLEIVRRLGAVYGLNVVLDEHRKLCAVTFGGLEPSHLEAVKYLSRHTEIPVTRQFRTVITSAAGHPLDATYYQTVKAMVAPLRILAPAGRLFVVSSCAQGLGSTAYQHAQQRLIQGGPEAFLREIRGRRDALTDEWQTQMQLRATAAGQVSLYTDHLPESLHRLTGLPRVAAVKDLSTDVASWMKHTGAPHAAVIPEGPYVIPTFAPEPASKR